MSRLRCCNLLYIHKHHKQRFAVDFIDTMWIFFYYTILFFALRKTQFLFKHSLDWIEGKVVWFFAHTTEIGFDKTLVCLYVIIIIFFHLFFKVPLFIILIRLKLWLLHMAFFEKSITKHIAIRQDYIKNWNYCYFHPLLLFIGRGGCAEDWQEKTYSPFTSRRHFVAEIYTSKCLWCVIIYIKLLYFIWKIKNHTALLLLLLRCLLFFDTHTQTPIRVICAQYRHKRKHGDGISWTAKKTII
jgi:hypothetical protein